MQQLCEEKASGAALLSETWRLIESPGRAGKRYKARLIDAGEGSSAFYSPEALQQAATDRIFAKGTRIHLDHPRRSDDRDLPERSVKDWCGVLDEDATYNETAQALEAPIRIFSPYQQMIAEMWDEIGMSIRAWADTEPTPTGKPKITRFTEAGSVDFVTQAGRGGKLLEVLESRMAEATYRDRRDQIDTAVKDTYQTDQHYVWVRDFDDTTVWFETDDNHCWQQAYTVADDDLSVTLTGDAVEVRPVTQYVPVQPTDQAGSNSESTTEGEPVMDTKELEAQIEALQKQVAELTAKNTTLESWKQNRENADKALAALPTVEGYDQLPEPSQERVAESLVKDVPATDAGDFDAERFNEAAAAAVKREVDYLAKVAPSTDRLNGFGDSRPSTEGKPRRKRDAWGDEIKEN